MDVNDILLQNNHTESFNSCLSCYQTKI